MSLFRRGWSICLRSDTAIATSKHCCQSCRWSLFRRLFENILRQLESPEVWACQHLFSVKAKLTILWGFPIDGLPVLDTLSGLSFESDATDYYSRRYCKKCRSSNISDLAELYIWKSKGLQKDISFKVLQCHWPSKKIHPRLRTICHR